MQRETSSVLKRCPSTNLRPSAGSCPQSVHYSTPLVSCLPSYIKVLIQDLWKGRVEWDDEIQGHHLKVWRQWTGSLPRLDDIKISRCYRNPDLWNSCTVQLHVFSDASEYAYSAAAYLRLSDNHRHQAHCFLVFGKCRNAPLKTPTIPCLELMASVMAVRISNTIRAELDVPIDNVIFWTDSLTVLQYIKNRTRRFHRFVATRLEEIHEHTAPNQ